MFSDKQRTLQISTHPVHNFQFVDQTIYGCGPLSIPIVDPRLVLEF
jgi:hypothetical protein